MVSRETIPVVTGAQVWVRLKARGFVPTEDEYATMIAACAKTNQGERYTAVHPYTTVHLAQRLALYDTSSVMATFLRNTRLHSHITQPLNHTSTSIVVSMRPTALTRRLEELLVEMAENAAPQLEESTLLILEGWCSGASAGHANSQSAVGSLVRQSVGMDRHPGHSGQ